MKLHITNTNGIHANVADADGIEYAVVFPTDAPAVDSEIDVELGEPYRSNTGEVRRNVIDPAAVAAPVADGEVA